MDIVEKILSIFKRLSVSQELMFYPDVKIAIKYIQKDSHFFSIILKPHFFLLLILKNSFFSLKKISFFKKKVF